MTKSTVEQRLSDAQRHLSGVHGAVAAALERRRVPAYFHLLNYAAKLRRAADELDALAKEIGGSGGD